MFSAVARGIPSFGDQAWKAPVKCATIAALAANTYSNGVLTASANGALGTIDGFTLAVGDRLLVKDEATQSKHGVYTVTSLGSAGTPWVLTRATDNDVAAEMPAGVSVFVYGGRVNIWQVFIATSAWTPTSGGPGFIRLGPMGQRVSVIQTTGTWTPGPGTIYARIQVIGSGGAGGGAPATGAGQSSSGSGGGGGGYAEDWVWVGTWAAGGETVTIGAAGAGASGAAGGNGAACSWATGKGYVISAGGGLGGNILAASGASGFVNGGTAGIGTAGTVLARGSAGGPCTQSVATGYPTGMGGASLMGGSVICPFNSNGNTGAAYGGGGSGTLNGASQVARTGGNGALGAVIITEFFTF